MRPSHRVGRLREQREDSSKSMPIRQLFGERAHAGDPGPSYYGKDSRWRSRVRTVREQNQKRRAKRWVTIPPIKPKMNGVPIANNKFNMGMKVISIFNQIPPELRSTSGRSKHMAAVWKILALGISNHRVPGSVFRIIHQHLTSKHFSHFPKRLCKYWITSDPDSFGKKSSEKKNYRLTKCSVHGLSTERSRRFRCPRPPVQE